jgi:acetylornithine deacetylase/succinyl-diaminopimelate desuccinylase-like protein
MCLIDIVCKGRAGHASIPTSADNALVRASEVIYRLGNFWAPSVSLAWGNWTRSLCAQWETLGSR